MRDAILKGETLQAATYGDGEMRKIRLKTGVDPAARGANGETQISLVSWHLGPSEVLGLLFYGEVPGWHGFLNPKPGAHDLQQMILSPYFS